MRKYNTFIVVVKWFYPNLVTLHNNPPLFPQQGQYLRQSTLLIDCLAVH